MKASDIVEYLNQIQLPAKLDSENGKVIVEKIASLAEATNSELSFFSDRKRLADLKTTNASLVLIREQDLSDCPAPAIVVENPYLAYAKIAQLLYPIRVNPGKSSGAIIDQSAEVPASCEIAPGVVIGEKVVLGEGCKILSGTVLEPGVRLGDQVMIGPNTTLMADTVVGSQVTIEAGTVIGGQGFGFAPNQDGWERIPQVGRVVIGDHVWIGNNCAIDRGAINDTVIHANVIIDNLVHIAHNVEIGAGSAIAGQVGFAGSTLVGKHCTFAGQVGVTGHISIADHSHFGAKAGVTHAIKEGGSYSGFPAVQTKTWQKNTVRAQRLDKMADKIKLLEYELQQLKDQLDN